MPASRSRQPSAAAQSRRLDAFLEMLTAERGAARLATLRSAMVAGLTNIGLDVNDGRAPFVLFTVPDAQLMRKHLDSKGIAVRRCDTFVGLDGEYLRAAVRPHWPVLVDVLAERLR